MIASILHRATGVALSVAGLAILTWWLFALANGTDMYTRFTSIANAWFGRVVLIGLTWSFFQHLLTGIRHLIMDTGGIFELGVNKRSALLTFIGGVILTVLLWADLLGVAK